MFFEEYPNMHLKANIDLVVKKKTENPSSDEIVQYKSSVSDQSNTLFRNFKEFETKIVIHLINNSTT